MSDLQAEDEARKRGLHAVLHTQLEAAVAAALAGQPNDFTVLTVHALMPRYYQTVLTDHQRLDQVWCA